MEPAPKGWRDVEKDALVTHHLQLVVGYVVAVLDTVHARVDGNLDGTLAYGMSSNLLWAR